MRGAEDRIKAKGAHVVFIGNGAPHMAKAFQEDYAIGTPVYTDPERVVYKLAEFAKGGSMWKALKNTPRALAAGFIQGRTQGDTFQLGGVFVIDKAGEVLYRYASEAAGDHPSVDAILAALG